MVDAPTGTLNDALDRAARLLLSNPALAERQAEEILQVVPNDPRAVLVVGMARRRRGDAAGARAVLEPLARGQPRSAQTHHELGMVLAALGEEADALAALRRAVAFKRELPEAWRTIGDLLTARGDLAGADAAYAQHIRASVTDPRLMAAADALCDDRLAVAEHLLRDHLKAHPTDVAAMRLLAETGTRLGRYGDVELLLARALELSPSFAAARYNLAIVLYRQQKGAEALPQLEALLAEDPSEPNYRNLMAACLGLVGEYERAVEIYEALLAEFPGQPKVWLSYGHALRTAGRRDQAVAAYHRCVEQAPGMGETYWSLANLKTVPFTPDQEGAMRRQLEDAALGAEDRLHFHYALGKALEDRGDYPESFRHYAEGARLRRAERPYDHAESHDQMLRSKALFTAAFFAERAGGGSPAPDPIFIVGLPRAGSTLIEQILASHSAVEGTMELPDIATLARRLGRPGARVEGPRYPEALADLDGAARAALGEDYLERTRIHRKKGRPLFIDKMPNNLHHIGLIQLILPNATIIDARRAPMASCFSAFKQLFARGHAFSYDLADLGLYYRDYVELMAHFDAVLPGRICRVLYEDVVEDTEGQVRRLLGHCGLPFEDACLRFHENDRPVRTASSEQVRRPIFREGLEQWRRYEPWLGPLAEALGPELAGPAAPSQA
ncbi:MAG TPA: sulfotransferase [Caulobacteraceae bacterium]|nr:sulfotransferase [Caulobacteraceae bacterium]